MANYFVKFSEEILDLSEVEKAWWVTSLAKLEDLEDDLETFDVETKFETTKEGKYTLWFHSDQGIPQALIKAVQEFLKLFRPAEIYIFRYSASSDKPQIGAFCGGAVFISAQTYIEIDPVIIAEQLKANFSANRNNGSDQPEYRQVVLNQDAALSQVAQKYLEAPSVCPYCNGSNTESGPLDADGKKASAHVFCIECGKDWVDLWQFVGVYLPEEVTGITNPTERENDGKEKESDSD